ncbi:tetratricopeptide repeat domain protein [Coleofasciculus chthonoplastes PCC 7420]|uniref:Tetratricopeptide repeat domain protein n=1 Tax=Coleofasciculus chthonoplastes PCC 7420 TaxID=118168 RepID=B4VN72_9CYAN|nr:CHAT domain-containing protein [Coleofasciculus chthonoplastes]EDX76488.1 tetratricopeptide repeat domain protein [Coleofasciculus chthonoplastes PCC 7420]
MGLKLVSLSFATLLLVLTSAFLLPTLSLSPAVAQTLSDQDQAQKAKADRLLREGRRRNAWDNVEGALSNFEDALLIYQEIGDKAGMGETFYHIGIIYEEREDYDQALNYYQRLLRMSRELDNSDRERALILISNLYRTYGIHLVEQNQYREALDKFQQALVIYRKIRYKRSQWYTLKYMGFVYSILGEYQLALAAYQRALSIEQDMALVAGDGVNFEVGQIYKLLGQYDLALESYQQALERARIPGRMVVIGRGGGAIGDIVGEVQALNAIGNVHFQLKQYELALDFYQQASAVLKTVANKESKKFLEASTLHNIGAVYFKQGKEELALEYLQQALTISQSFGHKQSEGAFLLNIGRVHFELEQYGLAWDFYQQALLINQETGDKGDQGHTLNNIGYLLEAQNQPELAIIFFKQAVNVREAIRDNIKGLSQDQQESYTETIADDYRHLADLLLQQNRILEAQRVLDLLKVQELDDYLNNVRGTGNTAKGVPNLPPEQQVTENYQAILDQAITLGKELTQLRQKSNRTPEEEQRIAQLVETQETILADFNTFIESDEVEELISKLTPKTRRPDLVDELEDFIGLQDNLRNLHQNAVLLYPLILDDRIELILTTPDSPPIRRTVTVTKEQLNQEILTLHQALRNPTINAKAPAQKLYNWLIKPLENDLAAADAETLIYAPDGQLRYIPLAALHDGEQWLVQRYRINNITAASLTELNTKPQSQLKILAGAFTKGNYSFTMGQEQFEFGGLPYAGVEVETLAATVPNTTQLFDNAFNLEDTKPKMGDYNVLHFATHGAIVVGTPEDSFILFGDGTPVTIADVRNWNLNNVDLVVLSACETGLGGNLGTGAEILGLGYQMQRAGARAAIASLWTVDDGGTQALMNAFYAAWQGEAITKAEALRQAQIALITGDYTALGEQRGARVAVRVRNGLKPEVVNRLSHPYYWAPFILIGNGL